MRYHFKIHKEGKGYWAQCIELPGVMTQANTKEELEKNMREALNLCIEEPEGSKDLSPLPDESIKCSKNVVEVAVDPQIAFSYLLRRERILQGLTQQEAARKMGFDTIFSYQRLERGKSNPSLKIISRVKRVFPNIQVDYALSGLYNGS